MARTLNSLVVPVLSQLQRDKGRSRSWGSVENDFALCWIWFNTFGSIPIARMLAHGESRLGNATLTLWKPSSLYHHHSLSHPRLSWVSAHPHWPPILALHGPCKVISETPQLSRPTVLLSLVLHRCLLAPPCPKKALGPSTSQLIPSAWSWFLLMLQCFLSTLC